MASTVLINGCPSGIGATRALADEAAAHRSTRSVVDPIAEANDAITSQ